MEYASRAPRFAAWVIDVIIVVGIIGIMNGAGIIETFTVEEGESASPVHSGIQAVTGLVYFVVLTTAFGATLGKMAMRMKVVDADGNKPKAGLVFIREFILAGLGPIPFLVFGVTAAGGAASFLVTLVVVFWILIDDKRQGLHDKAAQTFVVKA